MKQELTPKTKKLMIIYRVEIAVIIVLVLILAIGGLVALIRPPDAGPLIGGGKNSAERRNISPVPDNSGETTVFTGIGRLRIPVAGATVVLSVSFPHEASDRPFAEEIASRTGEFRSITTAYFSSLPADKITGFDEEAAKTELLSQFNALLRLGRIETLFFTDLMIIQ